MAPRHRRKRSNIHPRHMHVALGVIIAGAAALYFLLGLPTQATFGNLTPKMPMGKGGVIGQASDRVIIRYKPIARSQKTSLLSRHGLKEQAQFAGGDISVVQIPPGTTPDGTVSKLVSREGESIASVEPDKLYRPDGIPNDPLFSASWHLNAIRAPEAWDIGTADTVPIAICDTGVDPTHPDLAPIIRADLGKNVVDGSSNWGPVATHGTSVAGVAAAVANNGLGGSGVAWGASIIPVRVSNLSGGGAYVSDILRCVSYAASVGAKVINISYDVGTEQSLEYQANKVASKSIVVAAAGNDGTEIAGPLYSHIIVVGSTGNQDTRSAFSNYGSFVDLAAPGEGIYAPLPVSNVGLYGTVSGTSFSAPIVAGVLALEFGVKPSLSTADAITVLLSTADDIGAPGKDAVYGAGRVNAQKAAAAVKSLSLSATPTPTAPVNTPTPTPVSSTSPMTPTPTVLSGISVTPTPTARKINKGTATPTPTRKESAKPSVTPTPSRTRSGRVGTAVGLNAKADSSNPCCFISMYWYGPTEGSQPAQYVIELEYLASGGDWIHVPGSGSHQEYKTVSATADDAGHLYRESIGPLFAAHEYKITVRSLSASNERSDRSASVTAKTGNGTGVRISEIMVSANPGVPLPGNRQQLYVSIPAVLENGTSVGDGYIDFQVKCPGSVDWRVTLPVVSGRPGSMSVPVRDTGTCSFAVLDFLKSGYSLVLPGASASVDVPIPTGGRQTAP